MGMSVAPPQRIWTPPAQLFSWTHCIVHHTAGRDDPRSMEADNVIDYHTRVKKWKGAGYNWIAEMIEDWPTIITLRPPTVEGSHALGWNRVALGVVVAGNFMEEVPDPDLITTLVEDLFKPIICGVFHIPKENILPHRAVGQTDCPGVNFPITMITDRL
jgi:hypothetical protein